MVLCNDNVQNVLDRIFLEEFVTHNPPHRDLFSNIINQIENLDRTIARFRASSVPYAPFSWKRDNYYILRVQKYMFAYIIGVDNTIRVEEVCYDGRIIYENSNNIIKISNWLNEQYENIKKGSVIAPFNRILCNLSYYCQSRLNLVIVFLLLILLETKFLLPVL